MDEPGMYRAVIYASQAKSEGNKDLLVSYVENRLGNSPEKASFKIYHSPMKENLFASFQSTGTSGTGAKDLPMPLTKNCVPNNFFTLGSGADSHTIKFARPGWYKIDMFIYGYTPSPAGDYHIGLLKDVNRGSIRLGGTITANKMLSNGGSTVRYMAKGETLKLVSVKGALSDVVVDVIIEFISPIGSNWNPVYTE